MGFGSKQLGEGQTEVRRPSPRRDGLGAALRSALGLSAAVPDEFEHRLTRIDDATRARPSKRG
jgi:hypothetical protein